MVSFPLKKRHCVPCEGGTKPLKPDEYSAFLRTLSHWNDPDQVRIEKAFTFPDFKEALSFVIEVGQVVEEEQHHPDIYLYRWNKVRITLTTHAIKGLSENDFIMAAKIEELVRKQI